MLIEADISRGWVAKLQARACEALSFLAPCYLNLRSHTYSTDMSRTSSVLFNFEADTPRLTPFGFLELSIEMWTVKSLGFDAVITLASKASSAPKLVSCASLPLCCLSLPNILPHQCLNSSRKLIDSLMRREYQFEFSSDGK